MRDRGLTVATGRFGAQMAVELVNDGPVTIWPGMSRMRFPLGSAAFLIWIRSCSRLVCDRLAAVVSWLDWLPTDADG